MTGQLLVRGVRLSGRLEETLTGRKREFAITDVRVDKPLRGALLGPGDPDAMNAWAAAPRACPALLLGLPGESTVEDVVRVAVQRTDAGADDPVTGPMAPGSELLSTSGPPWNADGEPLLIDDADGSVLVARSGDTYLCRLRPDVDPAAVGIDDLAAGFLRAQGTAFVLRWVDLVVGRTDEEMPWGRRGPGPVAAPGLVLHPA